MAGPGRYKAAQDSLAAYMSTDQPQLDADERENAPDAQQQKMQEIMAGDAAQRAEQIRVIQLDPSIHPSTRAPKPGSSWPASVSPPAHADRQAGHFIPRSRAHCRAGGRQARPGA
jgi:hypothetical protein